jgi:hypothetical protein
MAGRQDFRGPDSIGTRVPVRRPQGQAQDARTLPESVRVRPESDASIPELFGPGLPSAWFPVKPGQSL